MARYTGPVCRLCRREGVKLYLKGDRCYTKKCAMERRAYAPGQHGQGGMRNRKVSEFGIQLREKQKLRRFYGLQERQLLKYYTQASRKRGVTGEVLVQLLELRLDNVVYRLGIGASRAQARQLVMHGHVSVDGEKVDIPSYQLKPGQVVSVRERSKDRQVIKSNLEGAEGRALPDWLEFDPEKLQGRVKELPSREQLDLDIREHLIVEYYSR